MHSATDRQSLRGWKAYARAPAFVVVAAITVSTLIFLLYVRWVVVPRNAHIVVTLQWLYRLMDFSALAISIGAGILFLRGLPGPARVRTLTATLFAIVMAGVLLACGFLMSVTDACSLYHRCL